MTSDLMKIIIADTLISVRSALRMLIEQELGEQVVGEASCASDLFGHLRISRPDLLILDWDLSGLEGRDRFAPIRELCPDLKVVALRGQGSVENIGEITGVDAVISKGDSPDRVLAVLRSFHHQKILPEGSQ